MMIFLVMLAAVSGALFCGLLLGLFIVKWQDAQEREVELAGRKFKVDAGSFIKQKRAATMTDKEKLLGVLKELGIGYSEGEDGKISLAAGSQQSRITGYSGLYCDFEFNKAGKFTTVVIGDNE